jgi:hypothetical protein
MPIACWALVENGKGRTVRPLIMGAEGKFLCFGDKNDPCDLGTGRYMGIAGPDEHFPGEHYGDLRFIEVLD